jgi:hypothetical protein
MYVFLFPGARRQGKVGWGGRTAECWPSSFLLSFDDVWVS